MKAAVGTLLLTAIFAVPAAADIRVWSERDRQGDGREIRRAVRDLRNYDFDDQISSLEADEAWEVCTEPLYRGDCRIVQGVVPNLRMLGLNNRITSMRKASEDMLTEISKPSETVTRSASPGSTTPPRSERTKAEPVPSTSTRKPEPATSSAAIKAEPVPSAPVTKPDPVPVRSASADTMKPQPVPSTPVTKPEPVPVRSDVPSTPTTKPESVPESPATAKNEPAEVDDKPADAWRSTKPVPAPPREPAPVTGEWWQGGDETAGAPPTLDLFEKPNFEGRRVRLDQAISDVTQLDQSVGSLLVRTGSWQICSKPKFRGRCRTVDATGMGVPETPLIGSLRPDTD